MSKHRSKHTDSIPGRPGYRTRGGRSGLDPIDNQTEASFVEGLFIRKLFTGKIRTRNPVYLLIMLVVGLLLLLFPLAGLFAGGKVTQTGAVVEILFTLLCVWPFGLALLFNFAMSVKPRH